MKFIDSVFLQVIISLTFCSCWRLTWDRIGGKEAVCAKLCMKYTFVRDIRKTDFWNSRRYTPQLQYTVAPPGFYKYGTSGEKQKLGTGQKMSVYIAPVNCIPLYRSRLESMYGEGLEWGKMPSSLLYQGVVLGRGRGRLPLPSEKFSNFIGEHYYVW